MKLKKMVCLNYSGQELTPESWSSLDSLVEKRTVISSEDDKLEVELSDADGLIVKLGAVVDKKLLTKIPNLKYLGMMGTGYGGIDLSEAQKRGVCVTNIAGYATTAVSEFTLGILLQQLRQLDRAKVAAKKGDYSEAEFSGSEIAGKRFGVIGLGAIGLRTAELAQAFGAEVVYWSRSRKPDAEARGIRFLDIGELLNTSDILTIHLALTPETRGFLHKERILKIKNGAVCINTSPMELVDLHALSTRLKNEELTFIFDHADEMSSEQLKMIISFPGCIAYPPIGFVTAEAAESKQEIFVQNLRGFLGGAPQNVVS